MTSFAAARRLALSLPEASEQPHHGFPSFRVCDKIFATAPEDGYLNVMLDAEQAATLATAERACEELHWGKRSVGVRVELGAANTALLSDLLRRAWQRRAPKRLWGQLGPGPDEGA